MVREGDGGIVMQWARATLLALALLAVTSAVQSAEEQATGLEELTITGTVIQDAAVFQHIPRVSLTAERIAARQAKTVADLLRSIAGVNVTQHGGSGGFATVSLRGGDPNFTLVMIDGVKVNDPTNPAGGGFDFSGLDPLLLERVDIYFGGYSAVYGSDALGGAINITTRSAAAGLPLWLAVETGTDGQRAGAASFAGALSARCWGRIALAARDGGDAVEGDSLVRQQMAATLRGSEGALAESWSVSVFASRGMTTTFPLASGGPRLAAVRTVEERDIRQFNLNGSAEWLPTSHWHVGLSGGLTRYAAEEDNPGIAGGVLDAVPPIWSDRQFQRENLVLSNTLAVPDALVLGLAAEIARETGQIDSILDLGIPMPVSFNRTRDSWAAVAEGSLMLGKRARLVTTIRHDEVGDTDRASTRVALSLGPGRLGTTASLSFAQGFKMPGLFALGHPLTGNAGLEAETSTNVAVNVSRSSGLGRASLSITLFENRFRNLIDFDAESFRHVNRAAARAQGVELSATVSLSASLRGSASLTLLDMSTSDGTRLKGRPAWKGGVHLTGDLSPAIGLTLDGTINGRSVDLAVPTGEVALGGYVRLDASMQLRLGPKVKARLMISNLLDDDYQEAIGFPNEGRQVRVAVEAGL